MTEQPALFEVANPVVKKPRRRVGNSNPRWSKYRPTATVKCDDCMLVLALAKGKGPASQPARWRRVTDQGDLLLCYAHAAQRREDDKLPPLKGDT